MLDKNISDWARGYVIDFSLLDGSSKTATSTIRKLSQMQGMFSDNEAYEKCLSQDDPVVYEFYELGAPENVGDLAFGTSITYPGKVGREYFMTKGHFHTILDTAEVYYTLSGTGCMMTENPEGDVMCHELGPGKAIYVPRNYAHRSINTGDVPLVTFFVFRADAGHDYGTIETKGYRKLIVEGDDGKPIMIDNMNWKE